MRGSGPHITVEQNLPSVVESTDTNLLFKKQSDIFNTRVFAKKISPYHKVVHLLY